MLFEQRLVDEAIAIPATFIIMRLRQRNGFPHKAPKGIRLRERLAILLVYPRQRTVCGDHHQASMLVVSLSDGRGEIQKRRTASDTNGYRLLQALAHTQGIETCATLIGDGIAHDVGTFGEIMHDRCIPTAWAAYSMANPMCHKQRC
jgi:hypothetical protein